MRGEKEGFARSEKDLHIMRRVAVNEGTKSRVKEGIRKKNQKKVCIFSSQRKKNIGKDKG